MVVEMYIYPFKENEEVVFNEREDVLVSINSKKLKVNILLSNKNILVFYNSDFNLDNKHITSNYKLIYKIDLGNMEYVVKMGNTYFKKIDVIFYKFDIEDFIRN